MRCDRLFALLAVCLLAPGCASSPPAVSPPAGGVEPVEAYRIGAEDVLEIAVWQNPDVSRTVTVRPDGSISLPLVDDVRAVGLSPVQLKKTIEERLKPFMATAPEVSVLVLEANSKRFFVQGQVHTPGTFPLRSRTTLTQAITMAGGFTEFARQKKIRILRIGKGGQQTLRVNYKKIGEEGSGQPDVVLRPDDVVIVP